MARTGLSLIETIVKRLSTRLAKMGNGLGRNDNDRPTLVTSWMMSPFDPGLGLIEIVVRSVSSWLLKLKLKRKMEKELGRTVHDCELTSITAWMKVPSDAMPSHRDRTSD